MVFADPSRRNVPPGGAKKQFDSSRQKAKSATTKTLQSGRKKKKTELLCVTVFAGQMPDSTSHTEGKAEIFLLPFGDRWLGLHSQHCPLGPFAASLNKMKKKTLNTFSLRPAQVRSAFLAASAAAGVGVALCPSGKLHQPL